MSSRRLVEMTLAIWWTLSSRIRFWSAWLTNMISRAATRPLPSARVARGVGAHLALLDDRVVRLEQELDRVLDRDDVLARPALVHLLQERGDGGGLAGPGGSGDQHQAAGEAQEARDHVRGQADVTGERDGE